MGFKITWDVAKIVSELRACSVAVRSPYNDGFTAWHCKQDLLQVKYTLDAMLQELPKFADEDHYIRELEKQQVWRALNKK